MTKVRRNWRPRAREKTKADDDRARSVGDEFSYPDYKDDWGNVIVVDNLPKIPMAKYAKLEGVLKRIFAQTGTIARLVMPSENEKTLGVALVEFATAEEAVKAIRLTDGYALDKSHVFKVNAYADLATLDGLAATYTPEPKAPFVERLNPNSWLGDQLHRDQFAIRYNNETEIKWCERNAPPTLDYGGEREKEGGLYWCEMYVKWSPQGSVLATFHNKGIALWGDAAFSKQGRFAHDGVKKLEFSPREAYMVTSNEIPGDKRGCIFWDLRTRKELRSFEVSMLPAPPPALLRPDEDPGPPRFEPSHFQWSHDDGYAARRGKDKAGGDVITVYELPAMTLLGKKSLRADGVRDFQWSPTANCLAYWAPEQGNTPARVTLVELPSRKELRQKNLVNVSDCKLYWHPEGRYLCVKVVRHTKSKKTLFHSFELFRADKELVPVEMLEMKDTVHAFAWEPSGHRFAVIHGDGAKPSVSFHSMLGKAGQPELTHLVTLENRSCNSIHWSPMGTQVVLAGTGDAFNGALEFYDCDAKWSKHVEHYRANAVEWDPSGRIVATGVLQPLEGAFFKFQMDNGYKLWTFQGAVYHEVAYENFYQFAWRPRPRSLLTPDQKKAIVKNLRKYERRFAHEDKLKDLARQREATTEKRAMRRAIRDLIKLRAKQYDATAAERTKMRNGVDADAADLYHVTTRTMESVVASKEEVMG